MSFAARWDALQVRAHSMMLRHLPVPQRTGPRDDFDPETGRALLKEPRVRLDDVHVTRLDVTANGNSLGDEPDATHDPQ